MIRRLPIRLKLTLAFTIAMAAVLTATALFLYLRLRTELDSRLDQRLQTDMQVVSTQLQAGGGERRALEQAATRGEEGAEFVQVIAPGGGIVIGGPEGRRSEPLLSRAELRLAETAGASYDRHSHREELGEVRVLARPVEFSGRTLVVAVGTSLEDRNEALSNLRTLLLFGEPVALALAALAAWAVVGAALRPVNEMLQRLEQGLRRERTFVADASHELRTPLTMLKMELELMRKERPTGADFDRALAGAIGDTDSLAELAEDLLLLARGDRGRLSAHREAVAVRGLLEAVAERYPADDVEIAPAPVASAPPATISADPAALQRALGNLVDNALHHGGGPVLLRATAGKGQVELHVSDEGPGFPPDFLPQAFDRFSQAAPSDGGSGTGLGLAIVRTIAAAHGGTAHLVNLAGGGADAWIELPIYPADGEGEPPRPS